MNTAKMGKLPQEKKKTEERKREKQKKKALTRLCKQ